MKEAGRVIWTLWLFKTAQQRISVYTRLAFKTTISNTVSIMHMLVRHSQALTVLMLSSSAAQRVLGGWAKVSCTITLEWLYEEDSDFLLAAGVRVCLIILGL